MLVGISHARRLGYCSKSIRLYADRYNLDLKEFVLRGLPEELLLETKDSMAIKLVEKAKEDLWVDQVKQ